MNFSHMITYKVSGKSIITRLAGGLSFQPWALETKARQCFIV
jgi:hypothetical protein